MKFEKICKIEKTEEEKEMYDLEVPLNHNFILANNILSHNSGKSRVLKLISYLSSKGKMLGSLNETTLFRTAQEGHTFCIDELERIGSKEKGALRELLNAAYKKGVCVERARKVKAQDGEKYEIEKFEVFCPICMANITGMEDVLEDRCISLILEKSSRPEITRKMEIFELDDDINELKRTFGVVCAVYLPIKNIYRAWNVHLDLTLENEGNYTNNTHNIHNINYTTNTTNNMINTIFFNKVIKTSLDGRHLELFFPLFYISSLVSDEIFEETIKTSEWITKQKKTEDLTENRDVNLIDFVANMNFTSDFIPIKSLLKDFKEFLQEEEQESKWTNTKWMGRALKRLVLVKEKRRMRYGIEVILDFKKAQTKIKMFRDISIKDSQKLTGELNNLTSEHNNTRLKQSLINEDVTDGKEEKIEDNIVLDKKDDFKVKFIEKTSFYDPIQNKEIYASFGEIMILPEKIATILVDNGKAELFYDNKNEGKK